MKREDYWSRYEGRNFTIPKFSRNFLIFLVLLVIIIALSYFNFTTGRYASILEANKTQLLNELQACENKTQSLTSQLDTCNQDLEERMQALLTCQSEKSEKELELEKCEDELKDKTDEYELCKFSLNEYEDFMDEHDFDDLEELEGYIDDLKDERNQYRDAFNELKKYAKYYCCYLNQTQGNITHYTISDEGKVSCGQEGSKLTC